MAFDNMQYRPLVGRQETYARLAPGRTFSEYVRQHGQALAGLKTAVVNKRANDASLARIDDSLKRGGSVLIASLAALGSTTKLLGVAEFLGVAAWFFAMAATPRLINFCVNLKTGVNLNQQYINTQGDCLPLFQDPKYLPLNLIPEEEMDEIAYRLNIHQSAPNRRRLIEERIRQISVQARTWWMLMAGPATPIISGLLCDRLERPIQAFFNGLSRFYHRQLGLEQAFSESVKREQLQYHMESYLNAYVGEKQNAWLARRWQQIGKQLQSLLLLPEKVHEKSILNPKTAEEPLQAIVKALLELPKSRNGHQLEEVFLFLKQEQEDIHRVKGLLQETITKYGEGFERVGEGFSKPTIERWRHFVDQRLENLLNTITHHQMLMTRLEQGLSPEELTFLLSESRLGSIQKLIDAGRTEAAEALCGTPKAYREIRALLNKEQYQQAFTRLGASPFDHLMVSLKEAFYHRRWRTRMGLGAVALLGATIAFTHWVVGRPSITVLTTRVERGRG